MPVVAVTETGGNYPQSGGYVATSSVRHDWFFQLGRDLDSGDLSAALQDWKLLENTSFARTAPEALARQIEEIGQALTSGDLGWALAEYNSLAQSLGMPLLSNPVRNLPAPVQIDLGVYEDADEEPSPYSAHSTQNSAPLSLLQRQTMVGWLPTATAGEFNQLRQSYAIVDSEEERRRPAQEFPLIETSDETQSTWTPTQLSGRSGYEAYAQPLSFYPLAEPQGNTQPQPGLSGAAMLVWTLLFNLVLLLVAATFGMADLNGSLLLPALLAVIFAEWILWQAAHSRSRG